MAKQNMDENTGGAESLSVRKPDSGKRPQLWTRGFTMSFLALSLISLCNYMFYSTIPMYAKLLVDNATLIGYTTGVYSLFSLAAHLVSGSLSDRYGYRTFSLAGLLLCAIGCGGYLISGSMPVLLLFRAVHGCGFGMFTTSCTAGSIGYIPRSRRAKGISYLSLYSTLSQALGPYLALSIVSDGSKRGQFAALFATSVGVVACAAVLYWFAVRNSSSSRSETDPVHAPSSGHSTLHAAEFLLCILPALIMLVLCLAQSSVISYLALYAEETGVVGIGLFFTVASVFIFIGRAAVSRIGEKVNTYFLLLPACATAALSLLGLALASSRIPMIALAVPYGFSFGMAGPLVNLMLINNLPDHLHGTATSFFHASLDIGIGLGSIVMGLIGGRFGYRQAIFAGSFIASAAFLIVLIHLMLTMRKNPQHAHPSTPQI